MTLARSVGLLAPRHGSDEEVAAESARARFARGTAQAISKVLMETRWTKAASEAFDDAKMPLNSNGTLDLKIARV